MSIRWLLAVALSAVAALGWIATAWGEEPKTAPHAEKARGAEARPARGAKPLPAFTPAREAAAMSFVAQNHPELRRLLRTLAESDAEAYQSAVRELFADSERLADVQAKDPELYAVELELWRLGSRTKLMVARMQNDATGDPEHVKRVRNLVRKSAELDLERRRIELRRLEQTLERRRQEIDELARGIEKRVDARVNMLLKREKAGGADARRGKAQEASPATAAAPKTEAN
jgi:hypothetical protein